MVPASGLPFLRRVEENGTLHDGERVFVPRGANYIRLNASQGGSGPYDPTKPVYHSTFSPIYFNATEARNLLSRLRRNGYNIVRVFVDVGAPNRDDGVVKGNYLSPKYMENVAVFVKIAASLQMYTVPTLFMFPKLYALRSMLLVPVFVSSTHLGVPPGRVPSTTSEMMRSSVLWVSLQH